MNDRPVKMTDVGLMNEPELGTLCRNRQRATYRAVVDELHLRTKKIFVSVVDAAMLTSPGIIPLNADPNTRRGSFNIAHIANSPQIRLVFDPCTNSNIHDHGEL